MVIKSLTIENIRSHRVFSRRLSETTTVITGPNGSGKTSLIEAITIALEGRSFKGTDSEMLRREAEWWRIDVQLDDQERTVKYQPNSPTGGQTKPKQFIVDGKTTIRLPVSSHYPVVLFEPDDLRLLHGSPSRRRQFIDNFITRIIPEYGRVVHRYDRALRQRNKLLKGNHNDDSLFAWNISLAKYGAQIVDTRVRFVERLNKDIERVYNLIAQTGDAVTIHYSDTIVDHTEQKLLCELEKQTERDKITGYTSVGPHRHDVLFGFNDAPATQSASRGEVRTIILALKFLEVDIVQESTGQLPIILLDDVFSELDEKRQTHLVTNFQDHQIIMTSVAAPKILKNATIVRL